MVVDDQEDLRFLMRAAIRAANKTLADPCVAASGQEALDRLDDCDPHVVVLDQMMPGMTGLETATQMLVRRPTLPIILCTAYLDENLKREAKSAGVTWCLDKAELAELPATVLAVASGK